MPRDHIKKSIKRFLEREDGESIKIINRKETEQRDEQLDPKIKEEPVTTDKWSFNLPSDLAVISDAGGRRYPSQAKVYVPGDIDVYYGLESDEREPSIIIIRGESWKTMRVEHQAFGHLKKVFIKSQELTPEDIGHGDSF